MRYTCMEVVTPNSTHTLTIYGRENVGNAIAVVYNEQTKGKESVNIVTSYTEGRLSFTLAYDMTEGNNYFVILNADGQDKELAKFKIFCTDSTDLQRYALTDGKYTFAPETSNKFKTA